jgi:hypothetical protein
MALFGKKEEKTKAAAVIAAPTPFVWPAERTFDLGRSLEVVGEMHHREHLKQVVGDAREPLDLIAVLIPEPENVNDSKTIAVHIDEGKVGQLLAADATRRRGDIDWAIKNFGCAAVRATVQTDGFESYTIVLDPQLAGPLQAHGVRLAVRTLDDGEDIPPAQGIVIDPEGSGFRLSARGGGMADQGAKALAKGLRGLGYEVAVRRDSSISGSHLLITGYNAPAESVS